MDIKPHQFVSYVQNENIEALVQFEITVEMSFLFCLRGALPEKCAAWKTDRCGKTAGPATERAGVSFPG